MFLNAWRGGDSVDHWAASTYYIDDFTCNGPVPCWTVIGPNSSYSSPGFYIRITPPVYDDIDFSAALNQFYGLEGMTIDQFVENEQIYGALPSYGGYSIEFSENEIFGTFSGGLFTPEYIFNKWRPISNVYTAGPSYSGDDIEDGTYLQRYYDINDPYYLYSSAPNIVNLYFDIAKDEISYDVNIIDYYDLIANHYIEMGASEELTGETLISSYPGVSQKLKMAVVNWNWLEGDEDFEHISFPQNDDELWLANLENNFYVVDLFNADGTYNILQNQYQSPGIKIIKAIVFSVLTNSLNQEYTTLLKTVTIRINLNLDDVYIEDFSDIGGADFTFIPWPQTSPIVGGLSDESKYINSMQTVVDNNLFSDNEVARRNLAQKAISNDQLGNYFGKSDLEQVRLFTDGTFDMAKLLGIENYYENVETSTSYQFYPYYKFTGAGRWDGILNKYPEETSVGQIFISENEDLELKSKCLVEINCGDNDNKTVRDTSGNGNKGILIGDFSVKKEDKDVPLRRDSVMKTPKTGKNNGAM